MLLFHVRFIDFSTHEVLCAKLHEASRAFQLTIFIHFDAKVLAGRLVLLPVGDAFCHVSLIIFAQVKSQAVEAELACLCCEEADASGQNRDFVADEWVHSDLMEECGDIFHQHSLGSLVFDSKELEYGPRSQIDA